MNKAKLTIALAGLLLVAFLLFDAIWGKPPLPMPLVPGNTTNQALEVNGLNAPTDQILEVRDGGTPIVSFKADESVPGPKLEDMKYISIYGPGVFTLVDSSGQTITVTAPITLERVGDIGR